MKAFTKTENKHLRKMATWGVVTFMIIHIIIEIKLGTSSTPGLPVAFNFIVSNFFARRLLTKGKYHDHPFLLGLVISAIVFLIRLILGVVFYGILI